MTEQLLGIAHLEPQYHKHHVLAFVRAFLSPVPPRLLYCTRLTCNTPRDTNLFSMLLSSILVICSSRSIT
jgi:hypothetical protein